MKQQPDRQHAETQAQPRVVRIPGFVSDEPIGLGEVIKRSTSAIGIKPCGGCIERAARLNKKIVFVPKI